MLVTRKQFFPGVNSSGDESISEDSEYVPIDNEVSSESDEISDKSIESESSYASEEENNARKKVIRNEVQKSLSESEIQNIPKSKKMEKEYKNIAYKDYVS